MTRPIDIDRAAAGVHYHRILYVKELKPRRHAPRRRAIRV